MHVVNLGHELTHCSMRHCGNLSLTVRCLRLTAMALCSPATLRPLSRLRTGRDNSSSRTPCIRTVCKGTGPWAGQLGRDALLATTDNMNLHKYINCVELEAVGYMYIYVQLATVIHVDYACSTLAWLSSLRLRLTTWPTRATLSAD